MKTHRYWNESLRPTYARAALTPHGGTYIVARKPVRSSPRGGAGDQAYLPLSPLRDCIHADRLQSIAAPVLHSMLPPPPAFAHPPDVGKRKRDAVGKSKSKLPDDTFIRTLKVRLWPSVEQRRTLQTWFAAKRLFYNASVARINAMRVAGQAVPGIEAFRPLIRLPLVESHPWVEEVPSQIKANGTAAAKEALNTNLGKLERNSRHAFELRFQSLRNVSETPTEVITFDPLGPSSQGLLKEFLPYVTTRRSGTTDRRRVDFWCRLGGGIGCIHASDSTRVVQELLAQRRPERSTSIQWEKRTRSFYLLLPHAVVRPPDTRPPDRRDVVAFDPGVLMFNAFYCPDGTHGELLQGAEAHIRLLCQKTDALKAEMSNAQTGLYRRDVRMRLLRTYARLRNFIRNAHYEAIKTCMGLGDFMVLPIFQSQRMARRAERVFPASSARKLYTWSHYSFSQRLWYKVQTTANKQMAFTSEPGTSKTCDACGCIHATLRGSRTFTCASCGYSVNRDFHGARGNLLAAVGFASGVTWGGVAR